MKIFVPFSLRDIGGPSSFVRKFKAGMERLGHTVTFEEADGYDILFVIVQAPFSILIRAKRNKKPIVQRLDGVYYWSVASWMFLLLNLKAALVRHFFADYSIYQSEYSQYCVEKFLGRKHNESSAIIYNGVDTERFSPGPTDINLRDTPEQKVFFTASEFRRKDQLIPLLEVLTLYAKRYGANSFTFAVAGSFSRELSDFPTSFEQYPWVKFLGKVPNEELPRYERAADVFLFTHLNPPCPNNILEAMSCGLPVCGIADGAMNELVVHGESGLLINTPGDAFWHVRHYDTRAFVNNLCMLMKEQTLFSEKSRSQAMNYFSLEHMLDDYETTFQKVL